MFDHGGRRAASLGLVAVVFSLAFGSAAMTGQAAETVDLSRFVQALPAAAQAPWDNYLARSQHWASVNKTAIAGELKSLGEEKPVLPPSVHDFEFNAKLPGVWYGTPEGLHEADIIRSFQAPCGGWSKHISMTDHARRPGESYAVEPTYLATIDNDSTTSEMRFLAKAYAASNRPAYREAFLRGLNYLFAAQYPNGGWPQIYPLAGGYHDCVTFNDNAMINVMLLLRDVAAGDNEFAFVPDDLRKQAEESVRAGIGCILKTQISVSGKKTAWCQQYQPVTLQAAPARAFEMTSICSGESAAIVRFLMEIENPNPEIIAAVDAAAAWFKATAIDGYIWKTVPGKGRMVVKANDTPPIWARFYEIGTNRPLFGDRDHSVHYNVMEISDERRNGYGWYGIWPREALHKYAAWRKTHETVTRAAN